VCACPMAASLQQWLMVASSKSTERHSTDRITNDHRRLIEKECRERGSRKTVASGSRSISIHTWLFATDNRGLGICARSQTSRVFCLRRTDCFVLQHI